MSSIRPTLWFCSVLSIAVTVGCSPSGGRTPGTGYPGVTGSDGGPPPASESCNGLDDDLDGAVDEDCGCSAGATQACWPGTAYQRGQGICRDGAQACVAGSDEFASWGPCEGAVLPGAEVEGNCVDEDCDGNMPGCTEGCQEFETCGNGIDDDCNGLADCADPVCECGGDPCATPGACMCEERCVPGAWRYCDDPVYCNWGRQDCGPDGRWGACIETMDIPPDCEEEFPFPIPIPVGTTYDPDCCIRAGHCCQNYGAQPELPSDASVGNCAGITETICM
jgi:hypothetical protein